MVQHGLVPYRGEDALESISIYFSLIVLGISWEVLDNYNATRTSEHWGKTLGSCLLQMNAFIRLT